MQCPLSSERSARWAFVPPPLSFLRSALGLSPIGLVGRQGEEPPFILGLIFVGRRRRASDRILSPGGVEDIPFPSVLG